MRTYTRKVFCLDVALLPLVSLLPGLCLLGVGGCEDEEVIEVGAKADLAVAVGASCSSPQLMCGDVCTDVEEDRGHCGSCGHACEPGQICADGSCVISCQTGLTACGGDGGAPICTNLMTDRASCGACGLACAAGQICADGSCVLSCPMTLTSCGQDVCTNLLQDPAHCGACDTACPSGQGSVCIAGRCVPCADGTCRVAFLSSSLSTGNLGGLAGADATCQSLAQAAGLIGSYRAWLSSTTLSASDRLVHAAVPYVRTDGARIANDWADLTSSVIRATIDHTETGTLAPITTKVFTGTLGDGTASGPSCADWTDGSAGLDGRVGVIDDTDDEWTNAAVTTCDLNAALYCFQQ